jgi:malonyl-CoA O-methyltransferase
VTLVSAIEGYRRWSATYDDSPNPVVALESRVMAGLLGELAGKRVADIACGTGRWTQYARDRGAMAIGIDRSCEMLSRCKVPVALADAASLPLPDSTFDVTICSLALGYLDSPLPELRRVTKSGGSIVVSDIHPAAHERGWKHSFRSGTDVFEIEHRPAVLNTEGLRLVTRSEPHFGEPERAIFRRAGKESSFAEMSEIPAIFIAHWIRV